MSAVLETNQNPITDKMQNTAAKKTVLAYLIMSVVIIFGMMALGVLMLLSQGKVIDLGPKFFYQVMTLHGTGMIGAAGAAGLAVLWYFLRQHVDVSLKVFVTNLVLFAIGVVLVLLGILGFKFAGGWTFLYPLPALSVGAWGKTGSILYLLGMLIIGTGFVLQYIDIARAIIVKYGSLGRGLGWNVLFGKDKGFGPPTTVVAATMSVIANMTGLVAGATVLVLDMINVWFPNFTVNPMLAKNLTYAFGHIFANVTIYMAIVVVYELLSRYTGRPWKSNWVFLLAWTYSTFATVIIYPHHLLMDFAMPKWALIMGQILSYANGFPVLVVTAYGALMIVYKSGIKWDMTSRFLFLSMLGWAAGVVPAIIDATVVVNSIMHNTKWVPGHFHMYMGAGVVTMVFAFMYHLLKVESNFKENVIDKVSLWLYFIFLFGLSGSFLYAGKISVPRRWAEHMPEWVQSDIIGGVFGGFVAVAALIFVIRFLGQVRVMSAKHDA